MHKQQFKNPSGPYFLSHSVGLQPVSAEAALAEAFMAPWAEGDSNVWDRWLSTLDEYRQVLAPIIGANAADICPQTNISSALTKILFSIEPAPGRKKIVLCEEDFPTVGFVLAQADRLGLEVVWIKSGPHLADPDAWAAAFADDAHLVHITHVFSNLGLKSPVAEIVRRAREAGTRTIVDAAQSAGAVCVNANDWGCDFLTGTGVKYLCGGPGAAYLWVNPAVVDLCRPADVGWFSHREPFEFDIRHFEYAPGAGRFWGGTPSVAPYALAKAGAKIIADIGVEEIERTSQSLIDMILAGLPESAIISHVKAGERGSSFVVRPQRLTQAIDSLKSAGIVHDQRAGGIRLSVHLYNDEADAARLIEALAPFC
jgi:selenocysteine lyase/cysteine desulfurase